MGENVAVTAAATTSCLKSELRNVLSIVTYWPSHRQTGAPMINIQSTLRTALQLCKKFSLAVLFGSNGNSYTISTQSGRYTNTHFSQYSDAGRAKEVKKKVGGAAVNAACQGKLSSCHRLASPGISRPIFADHKLRHTAFRFLLPAYVWFLCVRRNKSVGSIYRSWLNVALDEN
jgi:hypothetical protein